MQHPFGAVSMGALGGASVCIPPPVTTDHAALFGSQEQRQWKAHGGMGAWGPEGGLSYPCLVTQATLSTLGLVRPSHILQEGCLSCVWGTVTAG